MGSLVVHAAVPAAEMNMVMNGGDSSNVPILPSGFAIFPDCFSDSCKAEGGNEGGGGGSSGSLLTIGFQILVSNLPAAQLTMESVNTVKSLIARTHQGIKAGLHCNWWWEVVCVSLEMGFALLGGNLSQERTFLVKRDGKKPLFFVCVLVEIWRKNGVYGSGIDSKGLRKIRLFCFFVFTYNYFYCHNSMLFWEQDIVCSFVYY